MTTKNIEIERKKLETGIVVTGYVVSSEARAFDRKDGSGKTVMIKHEIALKPGIATWESFFDPLDHPEIVLEGDRVAKFPHAEDFTPIRLKALKYDVFNGNLRIQRAEML